MVLVEQLPSSSPENGSELYVAGARKSLSAVGWAMAATLRLDGRPVERFQLLAALDDHLTIHFAG